MSWLEKPKLVVVGFEVIKSSTPQMCKNLQKTVLQMILDDKSYEEVRDYLMEEARKIIDEEYTPEEIAFPTAFNQDYYGANLPKVRGQKWSNKNLNKNIKGGDKVLMLYVEANDTDSICFEHNYEFERAKEMGVKIDKKKMIDRNIIKPLKSIFEAVHWDLDSIKDKINLKLQGQKTLF